MYSCPYCKQPEFDIAVELNGTTASVWDARIPSMEDWLARLMRLSFTNARVECANCGYKPVDMVAGFSVSQQRVDDAN